MGFSCTTSSNTRLTGWLAFRSKSVLPMPRMQKAREGAAEGTLDVEAGHAARELTDVLAAGVEHLQRLALQRADGTGHVADVLQAALGGHGDDGQLAGGRGRRLGRRLGRRTNMDQGQRDGGGDRVQGGILLGHRGAPVGDGFGQGLRANGALGALGAEVAWMMPPQPRRRR
jgi:hypothetical protein